MSAALKFVTKQPRPLLRAESSTSITRGASPQPGRDRVHLDLGCEFTIAGSTQPGP